MEAVYRLIERVANTESTVLILGESAGPARELRARALGITTAEARRDAFRGCEPGSALPGTSARVRTLRPSQRRVHRGVAFDKMGLFQHADGGSILLDEIELDGRRGYRANSCAFQDRERGRVGDTDTIKWGRPGCWAATNELLPAKKMLDKTFRRRPLLPHQRGSRA